MSSTEVTERLGIPQFSISYADALTERGFKWSFYISPPSSAQADMGFPTVMGLGKGAGQVVKTAMILGDNQASSKAYFDACPEAFSCHGYQNRR